MGDRFESIMEITCTVDDALALLDRAKKLYFDAVRDIENALAAPRDS